MKKLILVFISAISTGCATSNSYQLYVEQTTKLQQANSMTEAACLMVLAEAVKDANDLFKTSIISHLDRCKKEPVKLNPPTKNWLDF